MSDIAGKLQDFLARETGEPALAVTGLRELVAGWSRLTYLATLEIPSEAQPRPVVVQVEKADGVIVGSSTARDVQALRVMAAAGLPVARPLWHSADATLLGGAFMVSELLPGRSFDTSNAEHRAALREHWERRSALPSSVVQGLASVHACPLQDLSFLPSAPSGEAAARYELERCHLLAQEARVAQEAVVAVAFHWLERHCPRAGSLALVHGDFHMRNLLVDGDRLTGIVDWEVARISDPLFDLAYMSIPYLSGKFFAPGSDRVGGLMPLQWLLEEYARRTGRLAAPDEFLFWRVLATLDLLLVVAKGVSDFEAGTLTSIRNAWARFSEPVLHEDLLNLLLPPHTAAAA